MEIVNPVQTTVRQNIMTLEAAMRAYNTQHGLAEPDMPLTHHFAPGAYGREIFLPKDIIVVGKIHKHAHLNMIMKGRVSVATEDGVVEYKAPMVMVSKAGTKRVVFTHEDTIWVTVHVIESQDLVEIEDAIIAKTYDDYDALLANLVLSIEHDAMASSDTQHITE